MKNHQSAPQFHTKVQGCSSRPCMHLTNKEMREPAGAFFELIDDEATRAPVLCCCRWRLWLRRRRIWSSPTRWCLHAWSIRTQSLLCWGQHQMQNHEAIWERWVSTTTKHKISCDRATRIRVLQASIARVPRANRNPRRSNGSINNLYDESTLVCTQRKLLHIFSSLFFLCGCLAVCFERRQILKNKS
jgi:hypothetical protein